MTMAQSEDTCVVSGMPRAAILKGYANKIIPLDGVAAFLVQHYGAERSGTERIAVGQGATEKTEKHDKLEKNDKHDKSEKNDKNEKIERTPVSSQRS